MTVGIDSNVVVYAGLVPRNISSAAGSAEQKSLARRAKILLHNLRGELVIFPMVAVSEVLVPIPAPKHGLIIADLKEMFLCSEFGDRAASIAAELFAKAKNIPADHKYDNRHAMLADIKIIATAKAAGAGTFFTNDDDCRTLATLIMTAKPLPTHSEELFIDEMLSDGTEARPNSTSRSKSKKKVTKKGRQK